MKNLSRVSLFIFFLFSFVDGVYGQSDPYKWNRLPSDSEINNAKRELLSSLSQDISVNGDVVDNIRAKLSPIVKFHGENQAGKVAPEDISRCIVWAEINGIAGTTIREYNLFQNKQTGKFGFAKSAFGTPGNSLKEQYDRFISNATSAEDNNLALGFAPYLSGAKPASNNDSSSNDDYEEDYTTDEGDDDDSGLWTIVIGALSVAIITGIIKRRKKRNTKKDKKDKDKKEQANYILQLNKDNFNLNPDEPKQLQIKVWKVTEKGKSPTNASIKVQSPDKALKISPSTGNGSLNCQLLLKGNPATSPFNISVTANAGGKSIRQTVKINTGQRLIVQTAPDNIRSLRPNIDQNLTCFAKIVDGAGNDIDELTKKIQFDPSQSDWIDLSKDPYFEEGWTAIYVGASDPDGEYEVTHPPKSVTLAVRMEDVAEGQPILQENVEIQLLDCMLETNLEFATFPATKEQSEITFKAYIENCDELKSWQFKVVYMKDYEKEDPKPLTTIDIENVSDIQANITLTGPILLPEDNEQFIRKLLVVSAFQKDEKPIERHIYVMVSKEGLFIEKGVDENNEIAIVAKGDFKRDLEFSLYVYNKETDQVEPNDEGLKNLYFELINEEQISKNIDEVLQTNFLFENIFGTMKHAYYKLDVPFMLPGTGEDVYELNYKVSVLNLDVANKESFQQIITLKVETYGVGRGFKEWREAYDKCVKDIIYYFDDEEKEAEFLQLLKTKGKELDVYGLVQLNKLIIREASKAIIADGKAWREHAKFLGKVIYVLEYVEFAGDIAFQVLVATFTGGAGSLAASAFKQTFITGAKMIIAGQSIDDFAAAEWDAIKGMLYSTVKGRVVNTQTIEKFYKGSKLKVWAIFAVVTFGLHYQRLGSIPEAAKATARQMRDEAIIRFLHGKVQQDRAKLKAKESKEIAKEKAKGKNDYETSKASPDTSGYTDRSIKAIQRIATRLKVRIITRPTNKAARALLKSGQAVAKKMFVKNKTISELDTYLGASKNNVGMVGSFKPKLSRQQLRGLPKGVRRAVVKRYKQRAKEWIDQAAHIKEYVSKGKMYIKDGVVYDSKSGKPFTGDIDIYDIRGVNGERISPKKYKEVTDALIKSKATNVEHGAHKDWQWWKGSAKDVDVNKGISDVINKGHRKESINSDGKLVRGEALVDFRPGVGVNTTGVYRK